MRLQQEMCLWIAVLFLLLPIMTGAAAAAESSGVTVNETPKVVLLRTASQSNHYGYITVDSMEVVLDGVNAEITVHYRIDPWIAFLVFLLGKQNLKERLLRIISYPEIQDKQKVEFQYVDNEKAIISVTNVSSDYGDGSYWYLAHDFAITIPELVFTTPGGSTKNYTNIQSLDKGFGYYRR